MKTNLLRRSGNAVALLFIFFFFGVGVQAQITWDGSESTDWATAGNWSSNTVPTNSDVIIIPTGLTNYPVIPESTNGNCSYISSMGDGASISGGAASQLIIHSSGTTTVTGTATISCPNVVLNADATFSPTGSSDQLTISGVLSGTGGLTKSGSGKLILSGASSSNTGVTTISSGTLSYGANNIFSSTNVTVNGGILDLQSYTQESATGSLTIANGGTLKIGGTQTMPTFVGGYSFGATSTVEYSGTDQWIKAGTYGHLVLSGSGTKSVLSASNITVQGNLTTGGLLSLSSDGDVSNVTSLIVNGTSTGNVTYSRYVTGASPNWHLIASPVSGQSIKSFVQAGGNAIATSGINYGLGQYTENTNAWSMYTTGNIDAAGNFSVGTGYELLRGSSGTLTFTGTLVASSSPGITRTALTNAGWNLVGNPFTAAISGNENADASNNFIEVNLDNLDASFANIYYWDLTTSTYKPIGQSSDAYRIASGQGFFVRSKTGGATLSFTNAMQTHTAGSFKSVQTSWPSIELTATISDKTSTTEIRYLPEMTAGLDPGYDAGAFEQDPDFGIFTRLVEDNGIKFAVQCLPDNDYKSLVIPIGLNAGQGSMVNFILEASNLPADIEVYLEDRLTGKFTRLDNGGTYSVILNESSQGSGRFFIHTRQGFLGTDLVQESPIKLIPIPDRQMIRITGPIDLPADVTIYDLNGRVLSMDRLTATNENQVRFSQMNSGIYLIRIHSSKALIQEKINWVR